MVLMTMDPNVGEFGLSVFLCAMSVRCSCQGHSRVVSLSLSLLFAGFSSTLMYFSFLLEGGEYTSYGPLQLMAPLSSERFIL